MKPWEQYQQAPEQDGPWSQYAAPTLESAVAATPDVGALQVDVESRRSAPTRFQDAFIESALGIPRGVQQLAIQAGGSPAAQARNQAEIDARRKLYNQDIGTVPGFLGAVAGGVVGGGALLGAASKIPRIGKAVQGALMPTTVGRGAALGATSSGLQPVASDESRLANAGTGGLGGAAGYGMGSALQTMLDRMTGGRISQRIAQQAQQSVADAPPVEKVLAKAGIDATKLPPDALQAVDGYVRQAMASGGRISPEEAARQALVESLPVPIPQMTRGQRTQNYVQQDAESLLADTEPGAALRNLRQNQRELLAENVSKVVEPLGQPATRQALGEQVRGDLLSRRQVAAAGVRDLYQQAEQQAGGKPVKAQALVDFFNANEGLEGIGELLNRARALKIVGADEDGNLVPNTVPLAKLNDLRRSATVVGGGADPTKGYFAGKTKGVIDDLVAQEGGNAYRPAIQARRKMGEEFDNNQGVGGLLKKQGGRFGADFAVPDEKVFDRVVKSGSIQDLDRLLKVAGPESIGSLRATLGNHLRETMVTDVNGQTTISLGALEREMKRIGPEKLERILGKGPASQLNQIVTAAGVLERKQPNLAGGSQTASRLANLQNMGWSVLERAAGAVPMAGPAIAGMAKKGAKEFADSRQVKQAMQPMSEELRQAMRQQSRPVTSTNALMALFGGAALPGYSNYSPEDLQQQ